MKDKNENKRVLLHQAADDNHGTFKILETKASG